jgi:hypothetical protein
LRRVLPTIPTINSLIDFAKNGFGDTQMFGLLAGRPELLKRTASRFAYFLAGEGGLIEPRLLELMRVRGAPLAMAELRNDLHR